jgi:hypothetical protein
MELSTNITDQGILTGKAMNKTVILDWTNAAMNTIPANGQRY